VNRESRRGASSAVDTGCLLRWSFSITPPKISQTPLSPTIAGEVHPQHSKHTVPNKITTHSYELVVTVETPEPTLFVTQPAPTVRVELRDMDPGFVVERARALEAQTAREAEAKAQLERDRVAADARETARLARAHEEATDLIERGLSLAKAIKEATFSNSREAFDAASSLRQIVHAVESKVETAGLSIDLTDLRRTAGPLLSAQGLRLP